MTRLLFITLCFLVLFGNSKQTDDAPKHWALLVAGSNTYMNYRHQADICHAYHIVRNHGIPEERIIVMMYDDIAYNEQNPFPGNIINEPNGPNVYPGVSKDYTRDEVTPEVFLKVLSGDSEGVKKLIGRNGKVIQSGPNDRIFVNFADHGAPGLLAFPYDVLHAADFNNVLKKMHANKQYKEMVIYVEACESGSMFHNILKDDLNIYATTAANPHESSYACYLDQKRETYLGDLYSVNWMQDSDVENLKKETLTHQFKLVKKETNKSHVMEYGDLSLGHLSVGDFQGNLTNKSLFFRPSRKINPNSDAVRSEDVPLEILRRTKNAPREAIKQLLDQRHSTKKFFEEVVISTSRFNYMDLHKLPVEFSDFKCYQESVSQIMKDCPGMKLTNNDYALRSLKVLANLCETEVDLESVLFSIHKISKVTPLCIAQ